MRSQLIAIAVVAGTVAFPALAAPDQPNVTRRESVMTAKVDDIDTFSRTVTFRTPEGLLSEIHVPPEIRQFDDLRRGDIVTVRFIESVIVQVRPDAKPTTVEDTTAEARAGAGEQAADLLQQLKVTVVIDDIDRQAGIVVYRKDDNMKVARAVLDRRLLEGLKPGDRVEVTYTKSRAISVEPGR
jgi:Cu/Ag efflux protein CusF